MSSLATRFWPKADVRGPDECWPWMAYVRKDGYGHICEGGRHGRMLLAHRVAYELTVGPIPDGLTIDHVRARGCTRRDCVNPAHLEPVTMAENVARGDAGAIQRERTHCSNGHPFDDVNTYIYNGKRKCRECGRAYCRRYYHARKAATA